LSDNFVRKGFGDRGSMHPSTLPCCCLLSQSSWANPSWTAEAAVKAAALSAITPVQLEICS
jgi:hypothetical protein